MFAALIQDLQFSLRQMRSAPGYALTVVLTLALSVGLATAVFCVIDTVILRPLPFNEPDKIVSLESISRAGGYQQPASWPSYQDERSNAKAFSALSAYWDSDKLTVEAPDGTATLLPTVSATDNFFNVFGVQPLLGRTFLPGEEQQGKNDIAVLSYDAWQSHFQGDRAIVNKTIRLNSRPYVIVGVMPAGFRFPLSVRNAIYQPIHIDQPWMQNRGSHWLRTVARVRDGLTLQQAQADITHVFADLGKAYPGTDQARSIETVPLAKNVNSRAEGPLWTLLGAVLALLAIGCVNVAGLLLARGVKRERETAMRSAVGAGRMRLVGQMLTEGLALAAVGAAGGVALAWAMLRLMSVFLVKAIARGGEVHLNWVVLASALGIAAGTSLLASIYPAIRLSSIDPNRALRSGGSSGTSRGQHRLRSGFVVVQIALTLVLLVVAGLLLRVVSQYRHADLGFDPAHILSERLQISRVKYQDRDPIANFYKPLEERVRHLPGVQAAGFINMLPIESWGSNSDVHIAGQPPYPPNQEMLAESRFVSPGYFEVMGVPLHAGRMLSPGLDRSEDSFGTVLVNDAFVRKFIPKNLDPTAQRIDDSPKAEDWTRIAGVVGNVRQNIYGPPLAERDWLMDEIVPSSRADTFSTMMLVVRTSGDPKQITPALRSIVHDLDASVPFQTPETMTEVVTETLVLERLESWLFGIFAALAMGLAMVGLYGLVSHEVEQARRDIGVRMALGATRARIVQMVLSRVTWMLVGGSAAGLGLTFAVRKVIGMVIYIDAARQADSMLLIGLLMIAMGLLAGLIPAVRAASTEPMRALRSE